ncbi:molybdopterin-dependent oxidoreductase [Pseudovibrio exalbescens]|uniref:xanthine dehydrogenase family protein molybdopterin-binding subunit n=1 Tax=Pseudovibrio exalbescens TaxID=197461 RepID=UPI002366637F|nr:molybdopterin cofactor-binding domain-containing protein [Pseudovibrio exalbescens]MDD7909272.1 molybdopterin-dependent oxidoreductase [Pseudovibrio exalbescens]
MPIQTSRRSFLKGAAATAATATAALIVGFAPNGALAATGEGNLTPFVKITPEGKIIAIIKHFEMGQGTTTGLTSLIAEELNSELKDVDFEFAPADNSRYANTLFGAQGTGGSTAMANSYLQYRKAGAAAREMLIMAAAKAWGVSAAELKLENGVISGAGKTGSIAEFVGAASALSPPEDPTLKSAADFKIIGNPARGRKDTPAKINGTAIFGMDIQLPGQIYVAIIRSPRLGGKLTSFDASGAEGMTGFIEAKALPNGKGVAVFAKNTWTAFQARDAVAADWDFSAAETRSSEEIKQDLLTKVNSESEFSATPDADLQDTLSALEGAAQVVESEFYFPNLAHAAMEPISCTIEPTSDGGVVVHDGCQFPALTHPTVASVLGLDLSKVQINTLLAGGSFGRRANADSDYHVEAAMAFALTDRSKPVKLVWSREDDMRAGYYRPAFAHKVRVGLDEAGKIIAWDHRVAGQSIMKGTAFEQFAVHDGVDHASVEGAADTNYAIPGFHLGLTDLEPSVTVLWWRAVGHTHTAYVMESMMDMVAKAAGRDPIDYRLELLSSGTPDQKRLAGVLQLAAEKTGWGQELASNRAQGVAVHKSFGTYVAEVVEISRDDDEVVRIENVTCVVDCGTPVNPDVIKAQMEGGIGYGLGAVMRNEITLENGEVMQYNFPEYEPLRIYDIAKINVHVVPSTEPPTGVGEPGLPPAGPALANAIAAIGPRVTMLPMTKSGVEFYWA